jgi:cytochrome c2
MVACGQPREQHITTADNQEAQQKPVTIVGEKLFKDRCASCHKLNGVIVGPALEAYSDSAGQIKRCYKFNTTYHTDTTLLGRDLDSIGEYVANYSHCSLPPVTKY